MHPAGIDVGACSLHHGVRHGAAVDDECGVQARCDRVEVGVCRRHPIQMCMYENKHHRAIRFQNVQRLIHTATVVNVDREHHLDNVQKGLGVIDELPSGRGGVPSIMHAAQNEFVGLRAQTGRRDSVFWRPSSCAPHALHAFQRVSQESQQGAQQEAQQEAQHEARRQTCFI